MENKFTKGEWIISKPLSDRFQRTIVTTGEDQRRIAEVFKYPGTGLEIDSEANAKLLAAAPDMLEALIMCVNHVGARARESQPASNAFEKAKAAIQKATA